MTDMSGGSYTPPPPPPGGSFTPPPPPPSGGGVTPPTGSGLIPPANPPKDPIIILVLNLLLLGAVGYFVLGQWQKGVAALVLDLLIGVPTCGMGIGAISIFAGIDGYMQAQQLQAGRPVGQWTFFGTPAA